MKVQKYVNLLILLLLFIPIPFLHFCDNQKDTLDISSNLYSTEENDSWTKRWNILGEDWADGIVIDSFNNIFLLGWTENRDTKVSYNFLAKVNNSGNLVWLNSLESYNSSWFYYHTIQIDEDNKIYLAGNLEIQENQYMILSKYDNEGKQIWNKTWGGYILYKGYDMDIDSAGNIYIVGTIKVNQSNYRDMYLLKLNNSGVMLWNHTLGGEETSEYYAIAIDFNDDIYIAGSYSYNSILMKYNSSGYCEWNYTWNNYHNGHSLTIDSGNNILLVDETVLQKLDPNGAILWNYSLPEEISFTPSLITNAVNDIFLTEERTIKCIDNSFFLATQGICFAVYLEKFSSSGNFLWEKRCTGCGDARSSGIAIDSIGNIYISGTLCSEFECTQSVNDVILMKNPTAFKRICIEIYYDLIILIITPQVLIGLIIIIKLIRRRKSLIRI
ncbi:MAG: hypothetical protein ACFFDL_13215 [Promethearchaeota archaeon]